MYVCTSSSLQECVYLLWECEGDSDTCVQLLCPALLELGGGGDDRRSHTGTMSEKVMDKVCRNVHGTVRMVHLTMHTVYNILIREKDEGKVFEKD